ncbi:MAG: GNAT family N-acetyltransferase [Nitrospirae bacterium]|nr:GNAT family N-acetyltransferase [Nitrospirota bacterium]
MRYVDIKEDENIIEQYISLRNRYTELLLTLPVNIDETKEWIGRNDIEVRGIVQDGILLGAAILYLSRDGEIAFFVEDQNRGIGGSLLEMIEKVAGDKGLKSVWAWVLKDNLIAQRVFEKNGYLRENDSERNYKGILRQGIKFVKCFKGGKRE